MELVEVDALPTHRGLEHAMEFAQRGAARHEHATPNHRADIEQPDLADDN